MTLTALQSAIAAVPAGSWGVGVSGGADSVALLKLLITRSDLLLYVMHLDHQTRGVASSADAIFVRQLAMNLGLPYTIALRRDLEPSLRKLPANLSARYRAARLELFRRMVTAEKLEGVILAHHADDQAETVMQRLIRGSGTAGLTGMAVRSCIRGLTILRPLLSVRRGQLRDILRQMGQTWREDASNASNDYLRNRIRHWLCDEPGLHEPLIALAEACSRLHEWTFGAAPDLDDAFTVRQLASLPDVLAREAAFRWLAGRGSPPQQLSRKVLDQLINMVSDAASSSRTYFPGGLQVSRRGGILRTV